MDTAEKEDIILNDIEKGKCIFEKMLHRIFHDEWTKKAICEQNFSPHMLQRSILNIITSI